MELLRLRSLEPRRFADPAVAVGNFDGVHRGHAALVGAAVEDARASGGTALVLTFDPHPARVLHPERAPASLLSLEQKAEALERLGVDCLAVLPFDAALASRPAEEFVRGVLHAALGARLVVVGASFRFGRGRAGDARLLAELGGSLGFRVHAVPPVLEDGAPVSSSRIRDRLRGGDVRAAARLLGRDYAVDGLVVHGAGRGRRLGAATVNLEPVNELVPQDGVYAGFCRELGAQGDDPVPCVANVGRRPTFGAGGRSVEAHLLGFEGDLYGRRLRLSFRERLRDERRFDSPEALAAQIRIDVTRARAILEPAP